MSSSGSQNKHGSKNKRGSASDAWIPGGSPGFVGGALGLLVGFAIFGWGLWSVLGHNTSPLPQSLAMLTVGLVEGVTCVYALRRVRIAWSFCLSLNGTALLIFVFGAARVSRAFDTSLAVGFVPAVLFLTVTVLLAMSADEYD